MSAPFQDPILKYLGPRGLIAQAISGYEHRPQQLDMARLIRRALDERRYCLIEAGTGTGKTLAYLVPALLSGRRVIVSTATKTLQDQILDKDLPLLKRSTRIEFKAVAVKGRANYVCLYRLEKAEIGGQGLLLEKDRELFERVVQWARQQTKSGEWSELDLPEGAPITRELSSPVDSCLGRKCPYQNTCFVTLARRAAFDSDLIIVNHHLLFADLELKTEKGSSAQVLPKYQALVFDEAHAVEDVATDFFGVAMSNFRVRGLTGDIEKVLVNESAHAPLVAPLISKLDVLSTRGFNEIGMGLTAGEPTRRLTRGKDARKLKKVCVPLIESLKALAGALEPFKSLERDALIRRCNEMATAFEFLMALDNPLFVYWAEKRPRGAFLRAAPIDVANEFRTRLYTMADTIIFTSATMAAEGRLAYTRRRLGLPSAEEMAHGVRVRSAVRKSPEAARMATPVDELMLDSPFDYPSQAALYTPSHLPEPQAPDFVERAAEEIAALCEITNGRALLLFTSLRNMQEAHRLLEHRLPGEVMIQSQAPKSTLIARFKAAPSVLFASHSFWEGVDIPGEALSLVIIDKLPFATPTDPVVAARVEWIISQGRSAFAEYQLPQAAILLRQGFGRLIRTRRDRGIVAVLDPRLSTKPYGKVFLRSLPPAHRCQSIGELRQFWSACVPDES